MFPTCAQYTWLVSWVKKIYGWELTVFLSTSRGHLYSYNPTIFATKYGIFWDASCRFTSGSPEPIHIMSSLLVTVTGRRNIPRRMYLHAKHDLVSITYSMYMEQTREMCVCASNLTVDSWIATKVYDFHHQKRWNKNNWCKVLCCSNQLFSQLLPKDTPPPESLTVRPRSK